MVPQLLTEMKVVSHVLFTENPQSWFQERSGDSEGRGPKLSPHDNTDVSDKKQPLDRMWRR